MQTLVERGCGLDVHQATVVACLLQVQRDGRVWAAPRRVRGDKPAPFAVRGFGFTEIIQHLAPGRATMWSALLDASSLHALIAERIRFWMPP